MTPSTALLAAFAPTGTLRVAINLGNPVLANAGDGTVPGGVSVDLARELAARLGVDPRFSPVPAAGRSVELLERDDVDVGFFAIDPKRAAKIAFTAPYVLIEGTYLVRGDSPIRTIDDVDRAGQRIVVGDQSAYDLFLTREIAAATLVRVTRSEEVVDTFIATGADVAAGVRQQLEADAKRLARGAAATAVRVLDGRFMVIRQAMGVGKNRGADAAAWLASFVEDVKASGFVADALKRHGIDGASVAPAGDAG